MEKSYNFSNNSQCSKLHESQENLLERGGIYEDEEPANTVIRQKHRLLQVSVVTLLTLLVALGGFWLRRFVSTLSRQLKKVMTEITDDLCQARPRLLQDENLEIVEATLKKQERKAACSTI